VLSLFCCYEVLSKLIDGREIPFIPSLARIWEASLTHVVAPLLYSPQNPTITFLLIFRPRLGSDFHVSWYFPFPRFGIVIIWPPDQRDCFPLPHLVFRPPQPSASVSSCIFPIISIVMDGLLSRPFLHRNGFFLEEAYVSGSNYSLKQLVTFVRTANAM